MTGFQSQSVKKDDMRYSDDLANRLRESGSRSEVELHEDREEAADRIEALQAENARFREALRKIAEAKPHHAGQTPNEFHFQKIAQEALQIDTDTGD